MRSVQEYHCRLLYFPERELLFIREMREVNFSRTDDKLLFLETHAFKDEKI